jgi:hypothetical protein
MPDKTIELRVRMDKETTNQWRKILRGNHQPQRAMLLQAACRLPIHKHARLWVPIYAKDTNEYPFKPAYISPIIEMLDDDGEWRPKGFLPKLYTMAEPYCFVFEGRKYTLIFQEEPQEREEAPCQKNQL